MRDLDENVFERGTAAGRVRARSQRRVHGEAEEFRAGVRAGVRLQEKGAVTGALAVAGFAGAGVAVRRNGVGAGAAKGFRR